MWTEQTLIVEITGVFGAGYLPGQLKSLQQYLRTAFRRRILGGASLLRVSYCVDDKLARDSDLTRRNFIDGLIRRRGDLKTAELNHLKQGLDWVDGLVYRFIDQFPLPVDIVLRRGGKTQAWALLRHESWHRINADRKLKPKLTVFLTAPYSIIEQTYKDPKFQKLLLKNQQDYCNTPERALEVQTEWNSNVKDLEGLLTFQRESSDKQVVSESLITNLQNAFQFHNLVIIPWRRVFISYATADKNFANMLVSALKLFKVDCWLSNLDDGDSLRDTFTYEIEKRDCVILIVTSKSLASKWVQFEMDTALEKELKTNQKVLIPIRIDDDVLMLPDPLAKKIREEKFIANFVEWENSSDFNKAVNVLIDALSKLEHDHDKLSQTISH